MVRRSISIAITAFRIYLNDEVNEGRRAQGDLNLTKPISGDRRHRCRNRNDKDANFHVVYGLTILFPEIEGIDSKIRQC